MCAEWQPQHIRAPRDHCSFEARHSASCPQNHTIAFLELNVRPASLSPQFPLRSTRPSFPRQRGTGANVMMMFAARTHGLPELPEAVLFSRRLPLPAPSSLSDRSFTTNLSTQSQWYSHAPPSVSPAPRARCSRSALHRRSASTGPRSHGRPVWEVSGR